MFGNPRGLLDRETSKPKRASETLGRLAKYFKPFWYAVLLAVIFVVLSTWSQVTTPELTGQVVDCYLAPAAANNFSGSPLATDTRDASLSNCWLSSEVEPEGITQSLLKRAFTLGGFPTPNLSEGILSNAERLAGLGRLVAILIFLFVMTSVFTGLTFFSMSWAGQHVLRGIRFIVFQHLHRLPQSTYPGNQGRAVRELPSRSSYRRGSQECSREVLNERLRWR